MTEEMHEMLCSRNPSQAELEEIIRQILELDLYN